MHQENKHDSKQYETILGGTCTFVSLSFAPPRELLGRDLEKNAFFFDYMCYSTVKELISTANILVSN